MSIQSRWSQPRLIRQRVEKSPPPSPSWSSSSSSALCRPTRCRFPPHPTDRLLSHQPDHQARAALRPGNVRDHLPFRVPRVVAGVLQQLPDLPKADGPRRRVPDEGLQGPLHDRAVGGIREDPTDRVRVQVPQDVEGRVDLAGHPLEGRQGPGVVEKVRRQLEAKPRHQPGQDVQELVEPEGRDLRPALSLGDAVVLVGREDQHLADRQGQFVRQRRALGGILQDLRGKELELREELRHGRHVVGEDQLADGADETVLDRRRDGAEQSEIDVAQAVGWTGVLAAGALSLPARRVAFGGGNLQQVSTVRIGVKDPSFEELTERAIDALPDQFHRLLLISRFGFVLLLRCRALCVLQVDQLDPVDPFHDQNSVGAKFPVDFRNDNADVLVAGKVDEAADAVFAFPRPLVGIELPEELEVVGLPPVIQFLLEAGHELVHGARDVRSNEPIRVTVAVVRGVGIVPEGGDRFDQVGGSPQQLGVLPDDILHAGSSHLDGDLPAVRQSPRVDDADARRRHGCFRQAREEAF
mmetsp:Transcript_1843/g.4796  ORF Transcript_1843/g.4796 Transcript_1843/m.4796 type:complete len:525 (-) Transcript_1843:192-1766(-)